MTSTANTNTSTSASTLNAISNRHLARANLSPPLDASYRHSLQTNSYPEFAQEMSQYSLMIQDTNQLDVHKNKFQKPYKNDSPSTDTLSAKAREILGSTHSKFIRSSNSSPVNPKQPHKSLTPPLAPPPANHNITKRPPSSTTFNYHSTKEISPSKYKKPLPSSTSNRSINYDSFDLDRIFDVRLIKFLNYYYYYYQHYFDRK